MNKEEKLKLFYALCIPLFFVINTHMAASAINHLTALGKTNYGDTVAPGDLFVLFIIYTMITGIANIFLLKRLRQESAKMFAVVMLLDTLSLILIPLVMILFNDIKNVPAAARLNLQNGELMFAFFGIKTAIMVKRYSGSNVADKTN